MAKSNKLYEKPRVTTIAANDLLTIGQLQQYGEYKVKTITKEDAATALNAVDSYTYAELEALSGSYEVGKQYLIENATSATINLIVSAVSVSAIGCEAKDPNYEHDVIFYDFSNNLIKYRLDTLNNISAGQDWRNSVTLQIGAPVSFIHLGSNVSGSIASGVTNIECGNNCVLEIQANSEGLIAGNDCVLKGRFNNVKVGNSVGLQYDSTQGLTTASFQQSTASDECNILARDLTNCHFFNGTTINDGSFVANLSDRNFYAGVSNNNAASALYTIPVFGNVYPDLNSDPQLVYLDNGAFVITSAI